MIDVYIMILTIQIYNKVLESKKMVKYKYPKVHYLEQANLKGCFVNFRKCLRITNLYLVYHSKANF